VEENQLFLLFTYLLSLLVKHTHTYKSISLYAVLAMTPVTTTPNEPRVKSLVAAHA
jgi:hypothetical protein